MPMDGFSYAMRAYEFVTNTPLIIADTKSELVDDVAVVRTSRPLPSLNSGPLPSGGMIERCVVVQRQTDGYGLTVTGDHPVYVHTVRPDGAAYCAGVRQGDRILKVNGMPVTSSNHLEVVRMISGGQNVVLSLLGKPPDPLPIYINAEIKNEYMKPTVTDPMQINGPEKEEWKRKRKDVLSQMLDEERRHVEGLRESSESAEKLESALRRINSLQSQLRGNTQRLPPHHNFMQVGLHGGQDAISDGSENDEEMLSSDVPGPFSNMNDLKSHPAHLAVFISYLLSNANPSSLFFYLITDAYQQTHAPAKDLRRWAFEIFTTFVVPNSPMCISNLDHQSIIQPIDKLFSTTAQDVRESEAESFRKIFLSARQRALMDINEYLADFRLKRNIGLGTLFDANQLAEAGGDANMEWRIGESLLLRALESNLGSANHDYEACPPHTQALLSSLATLIKVVLCLKPNVSQWEKLLERCPTFVSKDKSGKFKMKTPTKKSVQVKGHAFSYNPVNIVQYCYQCRDVIGGIQPHAYSCANCDVIIHKNCASSLADSCYPASQTTKSKDVKIKQRKSKDEEDERHSRDDSTTRAEPGVKSTSSDSGIGVEPHEKAVSRSQSMRSRMSIPNGINFRCFGLTSDVIPERRNRSALSWGTDLTPADEQEESLRSASFTSRDRSKDPRPIDVVSVSGSSGMSHCSLPEDEVRRMMDRINLSTLSEGDSDLEVESEVPALEAIVGWEVIRHLKPKEKKRQEVINELFHTERTHVRNLKILYKIFYTPMLMQNVISPDVVKLLFSNIEELLEIHGNINKAMRAAVEEWKRDPNLNGLYGDIGDLMERHFSGAAGEKLNNATSTFCQHQQHALEILRTRYRKDKEDSLSRFLAEAESNPLCRKLQLKDMLPVEMQRLVKYPMLLETVAKYTNEPSEEQEQLLRTVTSAKKILSAVNSAKRNAENLRRLEELQRRIDTTPFDKEFSGHDYAALNLTKYQLVHDGSLTCRFNRGKMVELHAVLLEHMLVLLTKQGDAHKLQLKCLEPTKETKWAPVLPLSPLIAKEKANDKRAFFLVYNSSNGAQIYELVAPTATERKTWFKLMSDQIDHNKKLQPQGVPPYLDVNASGSGDGGASDGQMAKVHVLTHPRLVSANEIRIEQPTILEHARPVLTPTERLRRADQVIFDALTDKHAILAQFLLGEKSGRMEELEKLTEMLGGLSVQDLKQRDAKELAMAAIVHGNRLLDSINQGMSVHKTSDDASTGAPVLELTDTDRNLPSVPCYKLTAIAAPLMNHLKAMMQVIQDQQNEVNALKQQLYQYKELAEGPKDHRSVSEETLTECSSLSTDPSERKLLTKRHRAPSIPPQLPTSLPPAS